MPGKPQILVPVDFSTCSKSALGSALKIAEKDGSEITIVHVTETSGENIAAFFSMSVTNRFKESTRTIQEAKFDEIFGHAQMNDVVTDRIILQGTPAREIARLAEAREFDLIVMGTHGRSGVGRLFMGSVAETVVRTAPCPVLTVKLKGQHSVAA